MDWNEYTQKVLEIANRRLNKVDANAALWCRKYICDQISYYRSRWADHQKYGLKSAEEFAKSIGYG